MNDPKVIQVKVLRTDGTDEMSVNVPEKLWKKVPRILGLVNCLEYALAEAKNLGVTMPAETAQEPEQSTITDKNEINRLNIVNNGSMTINL